ncbi:hypothetical protein MKX01_001504 [Papaver californicum]|nr:hypothetical protein MKX01_001504 [Papaver californicum]
MPGPGPHTTYTIGSGVGLMSLSQGRFSPQHCIIYATNAFLGPGLGSLSEWLTSTIGFGHKIFLEKGVLDSISGVRSATLLDFNVFLFRPQNLRDIVSENGHSWMYTWILRTGWWKGRAPINTVVVVGSLCTCVFAGFIYINRVKHSKSFGTQWVQSVKLILVIASLYCVRCASRLYLRNPPQPAVGEEADLGVIVFLAIYFFLPLGLCIMSMNPKDNHLDTTDDILLSSSGSIDFNTRRV